MPAKALRLKKGQYTKLIGWLQEETRAISTVAGTASAPYLFDKLGNRHENKSHKYRIKASVRPDFTYEISVGEVMDEDHFRPMIRVEENG